MKRSRNILLLLPVALAGCGYGASKLSHQAQIGMVGMSQADLEACAGPPDKIVTLSAATQIFNYVYKPSGTGGTTITLPLNLGGLSLGGSGTYCSANMRLVNHQVTEVHYAGDNDMTVGNDGVCAPIVRGCVRQPEPTMQPLNNNGASAFHAPTVPQQTTLGETVTK